MNNQLGDYEILYMLNDTDDYYEYLIDKYKPFLKSICSKYLENAEEFGYEMEDLMQVANIGVILAIRTYNENSKTNFFTYLYKCVENKLKSEIRNNSTNKKVLLNKAISYDLILPGTRNRLLDMIPDKSTIAPLEYVLIENNERKYQEFLNTLPINMSVAYEMRNLGFKISEISTFLGVDKRKVINFVAKAKNKLLKNKVNFD